MKAQHLTALAILAFSAALSSCVTQTNPVPEIPYRPRPVLIPTPPQEEAAPTQTTTWETAPAPSDHITETPADRVPTAIEPKPEPPQPTPLREQPAPAAPTPPPAMPITKPAAPSSPAAALAAATSDEDLKKIVNDGPIPTAMPVEGDPTRVWNPLDPSKKIRIIDPKTNQPYPSGKKLKVRKTNYQFYVP